MGKAQARAHDEPAPPAPAAAAGPARRERLLEERELRDIERAHAGGMTSRQIVDVFETRGIRFSEATLRKYVQLGLLPRSIRVGRKGKHRGSCGMYPTGVIRRVNLVKGMMAENLTIEEIQRSFARFKDGIESVEKGLRELMEGFEREARGPTLAATRRRDLEREIEDARKAAGELIRRISALESRISTRDAEELAAAGTVAGGGADLF